jgi:hypothetical protein
VKTSRRSIWPSRGGRRFPRRALVTAVAGVALCVSVPPNSAATTSRSPAATGHEAKKQAKAPAALRANLLIKGAKLRAALHTKVGATQDNGGDAPDPTSFETQAEVETKLTTLLTTLFTYQTKADAVRAYGAFAGPSPHRIRHLGNAASTQPDAQVTVRKGGQVLTVLPGLTPAGETYVVDHDKSPASVETALNRPALEAARALTRHMTGPRLTGHYVHLPRGAIDPCISRSALKKATHQAITVQPMNVSFEAPSQQCNYTVGSRPYEDTTYTAAQARTAISLGSPQAVFAADLKAAEGKRVQRKTIGPLKAFMVEDEDWTVEILVSRSAHKHAAAGDHSGSPLATSKARAVVIFKFSNGYTFPVSKLDCVALMNQEIHRELDPELRQIGETGAEGAGFQLDDAIKDWCDRWAPFKG